MYDVIVSGARCGGSPTAMLLARKGHRVLLVDRATFPSDIPHGHFIHRHGPARLHRWELLDRILATGCPAVRSMTTDFGDGPLTGSNIVTDGVPLGVAPRRRALDAILVEAAAEAGAEVRTGFSVQEYTGEGDRITGIAGREGSGGAVVRERARVTVGADGRNSKLARTVQAPAVQEGGTLTVWYFSYWSGMPDSGLEVYVRGKRVILAFPTNEGLTGIFIAWEAGELDRVRRDVEAAFLAAVDEVPALAERVLAGRREERFYGATDVPNFMRRPGGPGWALVGDAGCHKDPYLALGICDAFRDAELLADALDAALSGRTTEEAALAEYARRRDEATLPDFQLNLGLASFRPPPPEMLQLRQAIRGDQEATNDYFRAMQGLLPVEQIFGPERRERLMRRVGGQ